MDDKFDRIVRESFEMGGQARIRDTNITVNEIVRLSLDGMSQADILEKYPELDTEDIHAALSFSIHNLFSTTRTTMNYDFREKLIPISGFATLLQKNAEDFQKWSESIRNHSLQLTARINAYVIWMRTIQGKYFDIQSLGTRTLEHIAEDISMALRQDNIRLPIEYTENQRDFELDDIWTEILSQIFALLIPNTIAFEKVTLTPKGNQLKINIVSTDNYRGYATSQIASMTSTGSQLNTASLLIAEIDSQLQIKQSGDRVIFEFEVNLDIDKQD